MAFVALALGDGGSDPQFRAGAAIAVWAAVILGLALGLWPRAVVPRPALVAGMCLGGLAALSALSMAWADDTGHAFNEVVRVLAYLGLFVLIVLASSARGARPWLVGLGLGLAAVAVLAVASRLQPGLFAAAEAIRDELPPAESRLSFPTAYWNGLGLCMGLGVLLFTWLSADARSRWGRAAATSAMPVALVALFLTSSRGSVVSMAAGMIVLLLLGRARPVLAASAVLGGASAIVLLIATIAIGPAVVTGDIETAAGRRQGDILLVVMVLVAAGAGLVRYLVDPALTAFRAPRWSGRAAIAALVAVGVIGLAIANPLDRIESFAQPPDLSSRDPDAVASHLVSTSGGGRVQYWEAGLEAFASAPLLGIGAGGFEAWWGEHHTIPYPVTFAHSLFIGMLAELGLAGLALVLGFLGAAAWAGLQGRARRTQPSTRAVALAVVTAGTLSAAIDWMWELPAGFGPVVLGCALLTGPALSAPTEPGRSRFGFGVAALAAGWVTIMAAVLGFVGEGRLRASAEALEEGDLPAAIDAAETASAVEPWAAEPYLLEAAAHEGSGDLRAAGEAVDAALARAPGDWRIWAVAARIEAARGDPFDALEALDRANRLKPQIRPPEDGS